MRVQGFGFGVRGLGLRVRVLGTRAPHSSSLSAVSPLTIGTFSGFCRFPTPSCGPFGTPALRPGGVHRRGGRERGEGNAHARCLAGRHSPSSCPRAQLLPAAPTPAPGYAPVQNDWGYNPVWDGRSDITHGGVPPSARRVRSGHAPRFRMRPARPSPSHQLLTVLRILPVIRIFSGTLG